jgi:hypothetical protein
VPLRESGVGAPGDGLPLTVLGRLADSVSTRDAQREMEGVGARMVRSFPTVITDILPLDQVFEGDCYFVGAIVLGGVLS